MKSEISARTFEFSVRVVRLCQTLDAVPGVSRTLSNQLLRSGTSIGANVEEAHGSQSKADLIAKNLHRLQGGSGDPLLVTASHRHQSCAGEQTDHAARRIQPTRRHPHHHRQKRQKGED